jgi:hypothetical protein
VTSKFVASTRLDLYRDNSGLAASGSFDGYNDDPVSTTPLYVALPADITDMSKQVFNRATGRMSIIEVWVGRLRPGVDVREQDRLFDTYNGNWFTVDKVTRQPGLAVGSSDAKLSLTRIAR